MAKRKKHILTLEDEVDFDIIGICSHHNDYRLAWGINKSVGLKLTKAEEDYLVTDKKGNEVSTHSMYFFDDEMNRLAYYLVKNKSKGRYLISEKPTIDYFLFLCENNAVELNELISQCKQVDSILAAYKFSAEELPSVENIAFD